MVESIENEEKIKRDVGKGLDYECWSDRRQRRTYSYFCFIGERMVFCSGSIVFGYCYYRSPQICKEKKGSAPLNENCAVVIPKQYLDC